MPAVSFEKSICLLTSEQKSLLKKTLANCRKHSKANEIIRQLTGLAEFLSDENDWRAFHKKVVESAPGILNDANQEYGDFQTPLPLAEAVCRKLFRSGYRPTVLLEPTCGRGNFILAALRTFPSILWVYG